MTLALGDPIPAFDLPATDGTRHAVPTGAPATVVVFTCNHCPYALAWHERIAAVARDHAPRGVVLLHVNSNDASRYPRDSFEAMRERVAREPEAWPGPYLWDETQAAARAYGAQTTPDVFVADAEGRLVYRGAPDADWEDETLEAGWLRAALDAVLTGGTPEVAETQPVGCSIKWK